MALQIWLPLTKDLRNQGLSNVTVTNNGATFNSAGKLGGCYSFGTGNSYITVDSTPLKTFTEFSFACWVKIISWNTSYSTVFAAKNGTSVGWTNLIFALLRNSSNSTLCFNIADGSSHTTTTNCQTGTLSLNTWYHIVCTYKSGEIKLYQDGDVVSTFKTTVVPNFNSIVNLWIGKSNANSYQSNNLLNDVRIYDHCLSPMEVKELSKGLVLHYPLNRQGFGQDNLATCTTSQYNLSASTGNYNYFWIAGKDTLTVGETYTVSAEVTVSDNIERCTIYNYHTNPTTGGPQYNYFPADGKRHSWIFTATATGLLGYCGVAGATANHTAIYKNIKIEKGSIATPYIPRSNETLYTTMGLNGTTEYDTSGYCNNGIKNNSPTYSSDTAKYAISTHVDGVNQTIQLPNLSTLIPDSIFTFNIWFKRLASEPGSKAWETILGGPSGFEIETCSANNVHNNKIKAYSWGGGTIEFELDKWNMLTMVSNGANALFYLNGELKLTGTYKALVSGNYFLGSWRDTATQNYRGYMCDARIYATALSASDVKSLYQNCATIDPDGTIRGQIR